MASDETAQVTTDDQGVTVERVMEAPREVVWRAWSECEHFARWYGPEGFTLPTCEMDFRVGGTHLWGMRSPDGWEMWTTGVYREIDPVERFSTTEVTCDADGNPANGPGMDAPMETLLTVVLEDLGGGQTKMSVSQTGWADPSMAGGAGAGWMQALEKLADALADLA